MPTLNVTALTRQEHQSWTHIAEVSTFRAKFQICKTSATECGATTAARENTVARATENNGLAL